ncbi:MAG: hypothetical protein F6J89_19970 [Symploca sp. SIO1C4]|uniref:Uncharacterized protein n=1 Tax=Symploca sp. SIO1C4 TaxID=2607765 RepID=A0A6B3N9R6_9CYAN|nr:hypothetical protein [Symploca sp. SIO1C4]
MARDAARIGEQLANLNTSIINGVTINEDALFGEVEIPELTAVEDIEVEDADAGLGFTGQLLAVADGEIDDLGEDEDGKFLPFGS